MEELMKKEEEQQNAPAEEPKAFDMKAATAGFEWMITADGEKLDVITIRKRKIPLRFVLSDVMVLNKEVGNVSDMKDLLQGDDFMSADYIERIIKTIRILGNSGLKAMEKEPDLTDEWIGDRLKIRDINEVLVLHLMLTIWGGMEMETEDDDGKEVDVVLEYLRKKKEADS